MNHLSVCPSSLELTSNLFNMDFLVDKPSSVRIGNVSNKDKISNRVDARKMKISGQLFPGHLEGSLMGQKRFKEATPPKLDFVRTLLVDNYDSYTYNIYQELSVVNGVPPTVVRNDDWTWEELCHYLYEEQAFDNIVISPGPGSPTCPADIGICLQLLHECRDIPILGVCLGHQALGYVHGAQILHASEPVHGRLSEIEHNGCSLFHGIPSGRNSGFKVVRYHSLVIDADTLPNQLIPIAWASSVDTLSFLDTPKSVTIPDVYSNQINQTSGDYFPTKYINGKIRRVLMGVMHCTRPHYGVQFHPESVATCHGRKIFKNFRKITVDYWQNLRSSLHNEKKACLTGKLELLKNFAALFMHCKLYLASLQVPHAGPLFREVSRSMKLVNNIDRGSSSGLYNLINTSQSIIRKFLKLEWRKFDRLACQIGGAENIFRELFGHLKGENTFWLDSSSIEKRRGRFSFMGGKGGSLWKQLSFRLSDQSDKTSSGGGYLSIEDAQSSRKNLILENGFLDFLDKELQSYHYEEIDYEGLPFNFYGGYIGYIGYNLKVECGVPSNMHKSKTPDACFFFADNVIVIDHWNDDVYIMSINEGSKNMSTWLDDTEVKLLNLQSSSLAIKDKEPFSQHLFTQLRTGFLADKSREQYIEDVKKCLNFIKDGESYELCLTTQMRKSIGKIDPLELYLDLRQKNPAPYAAWLNFSKENLCICCSSPERFLRLDKNGILEAKPIKGTIARGSSPKEDEQLKMQLQHSEKDQAENLMIVDLLRNDLGRVCEPGSVHVPKLMEVESYATVHTMVSTIRGEKSQNITPIECVRAAFPGGSMTGAPKLRSMELLDSLESCSRGIYSGCIGYFSYNKTFDLNIVIRTVVIHEGEASIGAGGAIVALSKPEQEYEEMILKTRAPVKAVMECPNFCASDH